MIKNRFAYALEYTPKCEKLLDIGCDYGDFSIRYLKKAKRVYAIDPNKKAIRTARTKYKDYKKLKFMVASAEKLPFKDNFFDVVTITDAFEHVVDEKKTINEIYRVLKPNGIMVFSVPYKGLFRSIDAFNMKFYFPRLYKWWKGSKYDPNIYKKAPWHRHYSLKELNKFFKNKFIIEKKHRGGLLIVPIFWILNDGIYWKFFKSLPKPFLKIHNLISDLDYTIPYGGWAFHITLKARSLKKQ